MSSSKESADRQRVRGMTSGPCQCLRFRGGPTSTETWMERPVGLEGEQETRGRRKCLKLEGVNVT